MNIAKIKKYDITNGEGVRLSLFVSGCEHYCKNCFNSEAWSFEYGEPMSREILADIEETLSKTYVNGLSILGGEPLHPANFQSVMALVDYLKIAYPDKSIWVWTGYTFEELKEMYSIATLRNIDVLIDGRFKQELARKNLNYRGSLNQRVIDIPATINAGTICLLSD